MRIRKPDVGLEVKVRAPVGVVLKEGAAEATENGGIESINVVRRRGEPHLSIRQMKDYVFPLVPYVGGLKPKEQCKPVEKVVVGLPRGERRPPEVPYSTESGSSGANLRVTNGGVVS
ncbi:Uncharacterized protein Adt_05694 [Abeliophyllum distichum]|uniref:Uncharacterized protein n=1 Tax=Abeliophyllum distichum TaxID=126358 RepID=A0ABD1V627_9LAMI